MKDTKDTYDQYVLNPIAQHYIDKDEDNLSLNEESFKRELETIQDDSETSVEKTEKDKSLKDELKSNIGKTIV